MRKQVRTFYDSAPEREWERLDAGLPRIEFASTLRLIERYFPSNGAICDIGCGPGRYAIELARRGYRVTLCDLSEKLLERAERAFASEGTPPIGFFREMHLIWASSRTNLSMPPCFSVLYIISSKGTIDHGL